MTDSAVATTTPARRFNWGGLVISVITLLVAIIVLVLLSREQAGKQLLDTPGRVSLQESRSDYFMEGVISRHFDQTGALSHVLSAPRIDYFIAEQRSVMQQPHIQLTRSSGEPWQVRADHADAVHQTEQVQLKGNVSLSRASGSGAVSLRMETTALDVNMQARSASTDAEVRFTSPGGYVKATGLRADFTTEQLQLLAQVEGRYESPTR